MESVHIPEVIQKGKFIKAKRYKVKEDKTAALDSWERYLTVYEVDSSDTLERYLTFEANSLREEYAKRYGLNTKATRQLVEKISILES